MRTEKQATYNTHTSEVSMAKDKASGRRASAPDSVSYGKCDTIAAHKNRSLCSTVLDLLGLKLIGHAMCI
jgi:hypothetical protein